MASPGASPAAAVWVDGALVAPSQAVVSAFDHGLTVGDGVFETLRIYGGAPFALRRHLDRLAASADGLGLRLPDRGVLAAAVVSVVEAAGLDDARLRITVTGGPAPLGSGRGDGGPTVVVAAGPLEPFGPTTAVVTLPWPRNERSPLSGCKTTSYAENVLALARARDSGAGEAIFANTRGELCEGTGSNVVVAREGRLMTPPLSSGCLAGVTRALVLEVAGVVESPLPLAALAGASEAFLTSTTREIQPIAAVDGVALAVAPGPLTTAAAMGWISRVVEVR
ncbi:MAG TPA: aminotransferase class IV, partial [Acidimicrobiales bacterium]|nr:aminotransferase class IV [Acidimicrobiales bacterium]